MKSFRISLPLWILLMASWSCAYASPAAEQLAGVFNKGNSEYQKGNFQAAEQYYRQILNSGIANESAYYNLGNACFKQKRLGDAIYYWEKARQLLPNDREIRENLELANLLLVDRVEAPADPLPIQILGKVLGFLSITQEFRIILILFLLANILFFAYMQIKNPRVAFRVFLSCFALGALFLIFASSLSWKVYQREYRKEGIVVEQKVDVRSGPGLENIAVFALHEGIKVRVHESSNGWYQISLPNGWSGWLPQKDLRVI